MNYTKGEQCSTQVYDGSGFGHFYPCKNKVVVERDYNHYCKIHDPEYVKAKQKAKQGKWNKEWAEKKAHWELQNTAVKACKSINPDNPMAVAESISDLYEALKELLYQYRLRVNMVDQAVVNNAKEALAKVESKE